MGQFEINDDPLIQLVIIAFNYIESTLAIIPAEGENVTL